MEEQWMPRAIRPSAPALDPTTLWQRDTLLAYRLKIPLDKKASHRRIAAVWRSPGRTLRCDIYFTGFL